MIFKKTCELTGKQMTSITSLSSGLSWVGHHNTPDLLTINY